MCNLRYVSNGLLHSDRMKAIMDTIREMRGRNLYLNEVDSDAEGAKPERERASRRLSPAELVTELARRESLMQAGATGVTDQWRVYTHIIEAITSGTPLRLLVQASAGTGKSFLLTTVYLWCIVKGKKAKACAPTGIAAANVEIEGTDVAATTIHAMLDMDTDLKTKLDFAMVGDNKVAALLALEVLFIDEARGGHAHHQITSNQFRPTNRCMQPESRTSARVHGRSECCLEFPSRQRCVFATNVYP